MIENVFYSHYLYQIVLELTANNKKYKQNGSVFLSQCRKLRARMVAPGLSRTLITNLPYCSITLNFRLPPQDSKCLWQAALASQRTWQPYPCPYSSGWNLGVVVEFLTWSVSQQMPAPLYNCFSLVHFWTVQRVYIQIPRPPEGKPMITNSQKRYFPLPKHCFFAWDNLPCHLLLRRKIFLVQTFTAHKTLFFLNHFIYFFNFIFKPQTLY